MDTQPLPRILRLQPEIRGMFADEMDILSIINWRLTCKANYYQAIGSLQQSLTKMLDQFVPAPLTFLCIIDSNCSVLGGLFALVFILRDPSMLPTCLDMYASHHEFKALCTSLLTDTRINKAIAHYMYKHHTVLDALQTLVPTVLIICTARGTTIRVHRSYTSSSTAPITHAPCTALSNFITAYSFGCSHPLLMLNRRALFSDQDIPQIPVRDRPIYDTLAKHNFSLAFSPSAWPEFRRPLPHNTLLTTSTPSRDTLAVVHSVGLVNSGQHFVDSTIAQATHAAHAIGVESHCADGNVHASAVVDTVLELDDDRNPVAQSGAVVKTQSVNDVMLTCLYTSTDTPQTPDIMPSPVDRCRDMYIPRTPLASSRTTAPWRRRHSIDLYHVHVCIGNAYAMAQGALNAMTVDDDTATLAADNLAGSNVQGVHDDELGEVGTPSGDEEDDESGEEGNGSDDGLEEYDDNSGNEAQYRQPPYEQCFRHFYLCLSQGRYFGDRGSLINFFDPIGRGEDFCARRSIPPYGPMVVWRVLSNFDCERDCNIYDDDLEESDNISSIPVLIRKDPGGDLQSDRLITEGLRRRSVSQ